MDGYSTYPSHSNTARDAFGYALDYYGGDYSPIGGTTNVSFEPTHSSATDWGAKDLYNGNISGMHVGISGFTPTAYTFQYDQLNRLLGSQAHQGLNTTANQWTGTTVTAAYGMRLSYDGNGNIKTLTRNGGVATNGTAMDNLTYNYVSGNANRLDYIADAASDAAYTGDLKNQKAGNYTYDQVGNIVTDSNYLPLRTNFIF